MFTPLVFRRMSLALFAALGLFIVFTFSHYGISNDEEVQHVYGRLLLDFYSSGFSDRSAFEYHNLFLYGGLFDLIAALLEQALPIWVWDMRHLLSALFGLAGIVAAYKIARHLGGERAGFFTVLLLAITGAWTGAMFTHTKDVPFAACMAWALYYTILVIEKLPRPPLALSIKLGIAVGCALGLRIGGAFAVIYLLLLLGISGLINIQGWQARLRYWLVSVIHLIPAGVVAFILMAIFWPWGVMSPSHPMEAARSFSHFAFNMLTIMDGEVMNIGEVPRYYLPAYLLVRLPEVFLLGLAGLLFSAALNYRALFKRREKLLPWLAVIIAALFPIAFNVIDKPALYNGIRHFTFVVPPVVVLAGLGLALSWDALHSLPRLRKGFGIACIALCALTLLTLARLHPYEYIYYNNLAGSMAEAEAEWEGDYWSSSLREASDMLEDEISTKPRRDASGRIVPYLVAVCAENIQGSAYLDRRFSVTKNWEAADFYLSTTNMGCDGVMNGKIIGEVKRMGVVLAVVKDRRDLLAHLRQPLMAPHQH
ncbi:glycosyltransferase family 39 protein [Methylobacillus arboreus]|uniref:ArnT family glycosyltransferase n=1 Tax=Methylobacillus arboreus TaxID=755170 RepID=UPI001E5B8624|nr:glycosyltransferase family 39 protein [Methylobacillus arboreus]MCB5189846.1 glycosyltransferase family 39 protein [Methylobacillus arboreus]